MPDNAGASWAVVLAEVAGALASLGGEGWIVGGCLRDALLGVPLGDVDLAVTCEPFALARALRRTGSVTIATLTRESVRIGVRGADGEPTLQLDVSPLAGGSLATDLARRDFRVNALALPLAARDEFLALPRQMGAFAERLRALPSLVDPLGGLADLRERIIVPASGHALSDDPCRVFRAARLAARLGFAPSRSFLDAARAVAPVLPSLAGDRLRGELNALLALPRAVVGLDLLAETNAFTELFPNLGSDDALAHALASVRAAGALQNGGNVLSGMEPLATLAPLRDWYAAPLPDGLPRIVALRWGLLLHAPLSHARANRPDMDESDTVTMAGDGVTPAGLERRIALKVALYGHAAQVKDLMTDGDLRRARFFFDQLGDAAVDAVAAAAACNAVLAVAPVSDQRYSPAIAAAARGILGEYFTDRERLIPPRLLTGRDLIRELGIAPGKEIGVVLAGVRHAQLDGKLRTREAALAFARTYQS
jgi:poly(A) polymerase